jgi:hypothetical protein
MYGRTSQYRDIREHVAIQHVAGPLMNSVGEAPFEPYNVTPTTQIALLHRHGELACRLLAGDE